MTLDHSAYRGLRYFPSLDGLRAMSILLVLVLHANPVLFAFVNGGMGVHIFFTISGYLITTLALREEDARGAISISAFYVRRACRILPLYYLVLLFYVVLVGILNYHGHRPLLLSAMPYYATYMNDLAPDPPDMPFAQSWSLGVEEKFYLLWPALAFVLWRMRTRWRAFGTAGIVLLPVLLDHFGWLPINPHRYGLPLYASYNGILVGCLLAFGLHHERSYTVLARLARGGASWVVLAAFLALHLFGFWFGLPMLLYSIAVALLMVPVLVGDSAWIRLLAMRPMVFVGARSYAVYLVHMICLSVVAGATARVMGIQLDAARLPTTHPWLASLVILALTSAASLLVAHGLGIVVERRFIEFGRQWTRAHTGAEPVAAKRTA